MTLSKRSLITLLDLVENKLSCIAVMDREDAREVAALESAKRELSAMLQFVSKARRTAEVVPFATPQPAAATQPLVHA